MNVWQILNQFTDLNFILVLLDVGSRDELYRGSALDIQTEPEAYYKVTAMEPPKHAGEVILHVDPEDEFAYDDDQYISITT